MGNIKACTKRIAPFAIYLIGVFSLIAISVLGKSDIDAVSPAWRCPANGGINALYCYLRINGVSCDYSNLLRGQEEMLNNKEFTVLTLEQLAAKNGLPLKTFSLTVEDLKSCPVPVIIHMDGESAQEGAFLLLFAISDHEVSFMNGPSATIERMDRESFLRVWSGTALLPTKEHYKQGIIPVIFGFGIGLVLVILFRFYNRVA